MHVTSATGSRGFTLLELLVVLAVIVLIAAAWPLASSRVFAAQHLRNDSQQLAAAIRLAQMIALTSGIPQELMICEEGRAYQVASEAHELSRGVTLRIESGIASNPRFLLFPDGSASSALLVISLEQRTATLRVLPATGRVEVSL
jgi:general secretion pathway protein H